MNVLSLFDGISCARVALEKCKVKSVNYVASEIDKNAIKISNKNYSSIKCVGDILNINFIRYKNPNFLFGGSPCQDLSIAKKNRKGLQGERSGLFYKYVEALNVTKPQYFLFENVASMSKESQSTITKELGVEPIMINSALVSAQQRKRLYWTNIPNLTQPEDKKIYLKDIIETGAVDRDKSYCINANYFKGGNLKSYFEKSRRQLVFDKPDRIGQLNKGGARR